MLLCRLYDNSATMYTE